MSMVKADPFSTIKSALQNTDATIAIQAGNITGAAAGLNKVNAVTTLGQFGIVGVKSVRVEDPILTLANYVAQAGASFSGAIDSYYSRINDALGDPQGETSLAKSFVAFKSSLTPDSNGAFDRQNIVNTLGNFCSQVSNVASTLQTMQSKVETDLSNTVGDINTILTQLSNLSGKSNADLRDPLLTQLSGLIPVQIDISDMGSISIRMNNGSDNRYLLNSTQCAQLTYDSSGDMLSVQWGNADYNVNLAKANWGGNFGGLLNVKNTVLPKAIGDINDMAEQLASKVNEFHNLGSGYPPSSSLTSSGTMTLNDMASFSGKVQIGMTNGDGSSAGIKPLTIDFDALIPTVSTSAGKQFTVQAVKDAINAAATSAAAPGICIGAVPVAGGPVTQYLIERASAVFTSNISNDASGLCSFQFELSSGCNIGAEFQVQSVAIVNAAGAVIPTAAVVSGNPSGIFTLNGGDTARTGQNIVVNLGPLAADTYIRVGMIVVGNNGVQETRSAVFKVPSGSTGATVLNNIVEGAPDPNPGAGIAATQRAAQANQLSASFVDANGNVITDLNTEGYLKLSTGAANGLFIVGDNSKVRSVNAPTTSAPTNFSAYLGLNDLIVTDTSTPSELIHIRSDIAQKADLIALGKVATVNGAAQSVLAGDDQASWVFNLGGGVPNPGDTITINGVVFTFGPGAGQVNIGNGVQTITNLIAAIQASGDIRLNPNILSFAAVVGHPDRLSITAKAGTLANGVNGVATSITVTTTAAGGVVLAPTVGTNREPTLTLPSYSYAIGRDSKGLFDALDQSVIFNIGNNQSSMKIEDYLSGWLTKMSADCKNSEINSKAAAETVKMTQQALDDVVKADEQGAMYDVMQSAQTKNLMSYLLRIILEADRSVLAAAAA